jgi:aspartate carbamoyltransferase catalytic subunit
VEQLEARGLRLEEARLEDVLGELDVLYVTRIQRERFPDPGEYEKVRGSYRVTLEMLERHAKRELKVLHPLPKVDEIDPRVDESRYQAYFTQARLGVPLRMALLLGVMGGDGV